MGFLSSFNKFCAVTKADYRQCIADEKIKLLDAKASGDKAEVLKIQKEIERLKGLMANAPTKR